MLEKISLKFTDIVKNLSGKSAITEKNIRDTVDEIKMALLEADVNLRVVRRFVNQTIEEATGESVLRSVDPGQQFVKIVHDKIVELLGSERSELSLKGPDTVSTILIMGLNGAGKTTSAAKLALKLKKEGRKPLLVAADLVRPAAIKQLQVLGEQIAVDVYAEDSKDSVKLVKNALKKAKKEQYNTVIIDTAGRLHVDQELMDEIRRIHKAASPDETLLVADAMTGQHAVEIAKEFDEAVGVGGLLLTKFDSDARGGAALSLKSITGKPIKYIGTGEKLEDLDVFYPERIASRILGMGDVVSLVEKAQETVDEEKAVETQAKMAKGTFTLEDYLESFSQVKKMGSLEKLAEMIPGASAALQGQELDQKEIKKEEAIILSMTRQERKNYRIISPSRKKRVAKGSGTTVYDVNKLIKKFEKMRLMMKKFAKNKKHQAKMMKQLGMQ